MKIRLKRYSKNFPAYFKKEKRALSKFGELEIQHIGSSAVPGLSGKGWIDILIIIKNPKLMNDLIKRLESYGYKKAKTQRKERVFLSKKKGKLQYNLHVYSKKNKKAQEQIAFVKYLKKNPKEAKKYWEFKKEIFRKAERERKRYRKLKEGYFKRIMRK